MCEARDLHATVTFAVGCHGHFLTASFYHDELLDLSAEKLSVVYNPSLCYIREGQTTFLDCHILGHREIQRRGFRSPFFTLCSTSNGCATPRDLDIVL